MKRITKHGAGIGSFLFVLLLPHFVFASVEITEIMYDAPGADTGREWIEITNTGKETVDISKYKLLESGTNHGLVFVSGNKQIPGGSSAIVASDPKKFIADNPAFSGTLFDSAFALSNTGESLILKDASSTALVTASYVAMDGSNGEGGSLHKTSSGFVVGLPNAGTYPGEIIAVPKAPAKETPTAKKTTNKSAVAKTKAKTPIVAAPDASTYGQGQSASAVEASGIPTIFLWILALATVLLLGIAGVIFLLVGGKETSPEAGEFKIQ